MCQSINGNYWCRRYWPTGLAAPGEKILTADMATGMGKSTRRPLALNMSIPYWAVIKQCTDPFLIACSPTTPRVRVWLMMMIDVLAQASCCIRSGDISVCSVDFTPDLDGAISLLTDCSSSELFPSACQPDTMREIKCRPRARF